MSTCNRLDLETLGSRPITSKNFPGHWISNCPYRHTILNIETILTKYRCIETLTTWSWGLPIADCWPCHLKLPLVTGNLAFSLSASIRCNKVNARWDVLSTKRKLQMLKELTGRSEVLVRSLLKCVRRPLYFYFYWEIVDGSILVVCHVSNLRLPSCVKLLQHRPRTLMPCAMFEA